MGAESIGANPPAPEEGKHRRPGAIAISSTLEAMVVTNVLIRGLSDTAVERIDAEAAALGPSRNEFLRRKLEETTSPSVGPN